MALSTANMIYLGNLSVIDNNENDWDSDDPTAILGTYDSSLEVTQITENDVDNNRAIYDDEGNTGDSVSYTTEGGGSYNGAIDSSSLYNAIVTESDGSQTVTSVIVIQMPNGDTFVVDYSGGASLDNMSIDSIQLTSVHSTNYAGYRTGRSIENSSVCFCSGTLIDTPNGPVRVEVLRPGDQVLTADHGVQTLRWIGGQKLLRPGRLAPIEIPIGALGANVPSRTLRVSPQHRMLVQSRIAHRMFGTSEVLIPAKRLVDHPSIRQMPPFTPVWYWHMLFDQHEIVCANGAWSETLYLGPEAIKTVGAKAVQEMLEIFGAPTIEALVAQMGAPARDIPMGRLQKRLVQRHLANHQPWQQETRPVARLA